MAAERERLGLAGHAQADALCLSGGGIRSAAFSLGVIQALARRRLLRGFRYLSTVSGGGYTGAWLTVCLAQHKGDVCEVETQVLGHCGAEEPPELRGLRRFTSFLAPQSGLFSLDTWTDLTLWARNTLVNWAVFLPLFMALAALPLVYLEAAAGFAACTEGHCGYAAHNLAQLLPLLAYPALFLSIVQTCLALPSYCRPDAPPGSPEAGLDGAAILRRILLPSVVWALLAPLILVSWHALPRRVFADIAFGAFLTALAAYATALPMLAVRQNRVILGWALARDILAWLVASLLGAAFLGVGVMLVARGGVTSEPVLPPAHLFFIVDRPPVSESPGLDLFRLVVAGPAWVLVAETIRAGAYAALREGAWRSDLDREWLARVSALQARVAIAALLLVAIVLLPLALLAKAPNGTVLGSAAGVLGGPIAAFIGKLPSTAFAAGRQTVTRFAGTLTLVLAALVAVFIAGLLILTAHLDAAMIIWLDRHLPVGPAGAAGALAAVALAVAFAVDWVVNLNRFSMHAVYRNRLVRAFPGSARPRALRDPEPFTGFDPADNPRLHTLCRAGQTGLYPVINVTLNTTLSGDTARAERKGKPFVMTPLFCGSGAVLPGPDGAWRGAYVPTCTYAGADRETGPDDRQRGVTLGTAMTISGAAASPNMGYHSSFFLAFVMTLFNVRLGAWLPNPAWRDRAGRPLLTPREANRSGPRFSIPTLLCDLAGLSDDRGRYVYLSDGGHFDNLGLYEMLRRRAARILVVDAGQDGDLAYADLARALERARVDFGVRVTFSPPLEPGKPPPERGASARIVYPAGSGWPEQRGELLYLKPFLPPGLPVEITAHQKTDAAFPHDTTADQMFTETDFESHRHLGEVLAGRAIAARHPGGGPLVLGNIFRGA